MPASPAHRTQHARHTTTSKLGEKKTQAKTRTGADRLLSKGTQKRRAPAKARHHPRVDTQSNPLQLLSLLTSPNRPKSLTLELPSSCSMAFSKTTRLAIISLNLTSIERADPSTYHHESALTTFQGFEVEKILFGRQPPELALWGSYLDRHTNIDLCNG